MSSSFFMAADTNPAAGGAWPGWLRPAADSVEAARVDRGNDV